MRCRDIDGPHGDVKPRERVSVIGWRKLAARLGLVPGPERDREAVSLVDARHHSWIENSPGAVRCRQACSKANLELCGLVHWESHPGKNVAGQQTQREPVRDVNH